MCERKTEHVSHAWQHLEWEKSAIHATRTFGFGYSFQLFWIFGEISRQCAAQITAVVVWDDWWRMRESIHFLKINTSQPNEKTKIRRYHWPSCRSRCWHSTNNGNMDIRTWKSTLFVGRIQLITNAFNYRSRGKAFSISLAHFLCVTLSVSWEVVSIACAVHYLCYRHRNRVCLTCSSCCYYFFLIY